jgi:hypothetical protein
MFDDYEFKEPEVRIRLRFTQEKDEPMYPWEIAGFLSRLNTVYYKFELLNSISSALEHGISPKDIFILDKSLPLYKRYSTLNLLNESEAAQVFYPIGLVYPLEPSSDLYSENLLSRMFAVVNSYLRKNHVQPLRLKFVAAAHNILHTHGLDAAEEYVVDLALTSAQKSVEKARDRNVEKKLITEQDIFESLTRYRKRKYQLLDDLNFVEELSDHEREQLLEKGKSSDRKRTLLLNFFRYFDKISRPLVCARVGNGQIRVLGRSLVNKREQTGLEVKEVSRNSPLSTIVEGGIAIVQAVKQEGRMNELHLLDLEKKQLEIEVVKEQLRGEQLRNDVLEIKVIQEFEKLAEQTDLRSIEQLPRNFVRNRLVKAYLDESRAADRMLNQQGLTFDRSSVRIDIRA